MKRGLIILVGIGLLLISLWSWFDAGGRIMANSGSKNCISDTDCVSVSGNDAGCWNKKNLPKEISHWTIGMAGPFCCKCENTTCMSCDRESMEYSKTAIEKKDLSICDKIRDQDYRESYCYSLVAAAKEDPSICDKIQSQWNKDNCYTRVAKAKGDANLQ